MKTVIKKFAIDLGIRVGYGAAFLLLLISYLLTLYANSELLKQAQLVDHSYKVITRVENLFSSLKDAETGMRGFLIMKDQIFLHPYKESKASADSVYTLLQKDTRSDADQQSRLATLRTLMDKKYELMEFAVQDYTRHHYELTDTLRMKGFFGREIMDRIRTNIKSLQSAEDHRLKTRLDEMTSRYHTLNTVILISLLLAFLLAVYGFFAYSTENKARRIADRQVSDYQSQLQNRILQLDKANQELIQMRSTEKFTATGRIARTIAHEVRNPLTNINLAVDQLNEDLANIVKGNTGKDHHQLMLDMIARNSVRINQLITDLLNSTKFTDLTYKKMSVNQLLDETLDLARDRIQLHDITVVKNYSPDICDISVDSEKIKIAFLNIMVNAIEAMEPGKGILQLTTAAMENKCVVTITDNGAGIDKDSLSKLFEPYFTNKPKGTGLGLTNTQNIILNHNGRISIDSEKGKGTSFTIKLDFA